ncbi:MAG: trypsin-like serine peptidase [Draconibacterium sp.]
MPLFDVSALLEEDEATKGLDIPFRFGKSFDVNITLKDGKWQKTDSAEVWSLKITSDDAYSLNFIFSELYIPEEGEMYIFNEAGSMVYGPVTNRQNDHGKTFMTDIISGESVVIQVLIPLKTKEKPILTIQNIVHGYKDIYTDLGYGDSDQSYLCNGPYRDAECYRSVMGSAIDGVVQILLSSGFELCSGSLLNNTAQDYRPFILTAFHCIDLNENNSLEQSEINIAEDWLVRFGFKHADCAGSTFSNVYTFDDTHFRAAWDSTDFALVELQDDILRDQSSVGEKVWLGWNRNNTAATKSYYLHHPKGDVMKYAYDSDVKVETNYLGTVPGQNHWYSQLDIGLLEKGSSGSPIFDQNKRVVGQLHGGNPSCSGSKRYWHGCLHRSWTGGGTDSTRLSNWLDPIGLGVATLNSVRPEPKYSESFNVLCSSKTLSVIDLPPGYTFHHWNSSNVTLSGNTANPVQISPLNQGNAWVEAIVNTGWGLYILNADSFSGILTNLFFSFSSQNFQA